MNLQEVVWQAFQKSPAFDQSFWLVRLRWWWVVAGDLRCAAVGELINNQFQPIVRPGWPITPTL